MAPARPLIGPTLSRRSGARRARTEGWCEIDADDRTCKTTPPARRKAILYDSGRGDGVYVFPCATEADGSAIRDEWFGSFNEAIEACHREYGIRPEDWTVIPDPPDGCQHDWIAHVRIKGRVDGNPQWGRFERLLVRRPVDDDLVMNCICGRNDMMPTNRVFAMKFAKIYPLYVQKAQRKNRTKEEVDQVICWLTGYDAAGLRRQLEAETDLETFFAQSPRIHPKSALITGVVCGVRVEEIEDPLMRNVRYLDKLIDELAKGKAMEKILRQ